MAGIKHHILPKFFLDGFASRVDPKNGATFSWWFRRDHEPRETNTDRINVERYFYGHDDEVNVDPAITSAELGFSTLISQLRETKDGTDVSESGVVEFIAHLTSRTRHLRQSLVESTDILLTEFENFYSNETNGRAFIRDHYSRHPELIEQNIEQVIATFPGSRQQRRLVAKGLRRTPKSYLANKIERDFPDFFANQVHDQLVAFKQSLPTLVKTQHIKLLAKTLIPEPKVEAYEKLAWTIRDSPVPLVIGDVGCLFIVEGYEKWISVAGPKEPISLAVLPISPKKLVVGALNLRDTKVDFDTVNTNIVRRSREFFLANSNSQYMCDLHHLLATDARIFSDSEIQMLLREAGTAS
jgi:hypothetical protein